MLHIALITLKWLFIIIVILVILMTLFLYLAPTFGGKPDKETMMRIKNSSNFNGDTFINLESGIQQTTDIKSFNHLALDENAALPEQGNIFWSFLSPPKDKNPSQPIELLHLI